MGATSEIRAPRNSTIEITKWKVKKGFKVSHGAVLFIYNTENAKGLKMKSNEVGTVADILGKEGDSIPAGSVVMTIQSCTHPTVMKDMCADCGADLRNEMGLAGDRKEPVSASVAMIHSIPELIISEEQAMELGRADEQRLLKTKKLVLLVDLDQTLIHTTNDNIPANLKDVHHFQLPHGHGRLWYHTRFRPGTQLFLENISKLYELHICTFGVRMYAHTIAKFLDPEGKYFSHRILSRDECFDQNSKTANLKALFPCGDAMVCIIDDREDVWNFSPNLIHVKPYRFFQGTADINAPPGLAKNEKDDEPVTHKVRRVSKSEGNTEMSEKDSTSKETVNNAETLKSNSDKTDSVKCTSSDNADHISGSVDSVPSKDLSEKDSSQLIDSLQTPCNDSDAGGSSQSASKDGSKDFQVNVESTSTTNKLAAAESTSATDKQAAAESTITTDKQAAAESISATDKQAAAESTIATDKQAAAESNSATDKQAATESTIATDKQAVAESTIATGKQAAAEITIATDKQAAAEPMETENLTEVTNDGEKGGAENQADHGKSEDKTDVTDEIEWDDEDDYLLYLEDILTRIHKAFYHFYDQLNNKSEKAECPNLKNIIPYVKRKVLKGTNIVFSGVFPTNIPVEKNRAYIVAKTLGANIQPNVVPKINNNPDATTHVVAAVCGTQKVRAAQKLKGIKIVNTNWLWCCYQRYELVEETLFPLAKDKSNSGMRDSPDVMQQNLKSRKRKAEESSSDSNSNVSSAHLGKKSRGEESADKTEMSDKKEEVFSSSYNPLYAFSDEDIAFMDKEVEDLMEEDEDESEEDDIDRDSRIRGRVLSTSNESSSDEDSLSGEFPRGWKIKCRKSPGSKSNESSPEHKQDNEPGGEESEDDMDKFMHTVEAFAPDTASSEGESIGSVDDEMAEAVEKEFLSQFQ